MAERSDNVPQPNRDQGSLELMEEYIRIRAYELFQRRGCEHGHDVEDWLEAEAEILGKKSASGLGVAELSKAAKAA